MPYKTKKEKAEHMRRYRLLRQWRRMDFFHLMNMIAEHTSEDKGILARIVEIDFQDGSPTAKGKYKLHFSTSAVDWEHYIKTLETIGFPYRVKRGHCYYIRRATEQEAKEWVERRREFFRKQDEDREKRKDEVERLRQKHLEQLEKVLGRE